MHFQLVLPHVHGHNAAEHAIHTFKNHLIASICTCDTRLPCKDWNRYLPQAQINLSLLRSLRTNPSHSAYTASLGAFDFNVTPLASPDTQVLVHLRPKQRGTFISHGIDGWYIGPSMEHYRCNEK